MKIKNRIMPVSMVILALFFFATAVAVGIVGWGGDGLDVARVKARIVETWDCGANSGMVTCELDDNGIVWISGAGMMKELPILPKTDIFGNYCYYQDTPWFNVTEQVVGVVIEENVTPVGEWTSYTSIEFPPEAGAIVLKPSGWLIASIVIACLALAVFLLLYPCVKKCSVLIAVMVCLSIAILSMMWWWGGGVKTWYVGGKFNPVIATLKKDGTLVVRGWGAVHGFNVCENEVKNRFVYDLLRDTFGFSGFRSNEMAYTIKTPLLDTRSIKDYVTSIVIKKGVTSIGRDAFFGFNGFSSVTFEGTNVNINEFKYDLLNKSLFELYRREGSGTYTRDFIVWSKYGRNGTLDIRLPVSEFGMTVTLPSARTREPPPTLITVMRDTVYLDNLPIMSTEDVWRSERDRAWGPTNDSFENKLNEYNDIQEKLVLHGYFNSIGNGKWIILADKDVDFDVLLKISNTCLDNRYRKDIDWAVTAADSDELMFIYTTSSPSQPFTRNCRWRITSGKRTRENVHHSLKWYDRGRVPRHFFDELDSYKKLNLAVCITDTTIRVRAANSLLPTIVYRGTLEHGFAYDTLRNHLMLIKERHADAVDIDDAIIMADGNVSYGNIVVVMDALHFAGSPYISFEKLYDNKKSMLIGI